MTPNSPSAPSRRRFLASSVVVAAAVGGGMPLLAACGGGSGGSKNEGTTTGKKLQDILPTFVPSKAVTGDIPAKNGSAVGFTTALPAAQLAVSVPKKLGKGSELSIMAPLWGTSPGEGNPYWTAMDEAVGVKVKWQNQDGNVYGQKLGAVLASSSIPDAVVVPGWELGGKIPSAIANKFADLGPYLSGDKVKDYPNLAAIPTGAWQRGVFAEKLRGLPMPAESTPNITPFYRADIFEEKGYEVPTTTQEFYDLCKEINAPKSKVWACSDMTWSAFVFFGVLPEKPYYWKLVDGKLVNRYETRSTSRRWSGRVRCTRRASSTRMPRPRRVTCAPRSPPATPSCTTRTSPTGTPRQRSSGWTSRSSGWARWTSSPTTAARR